MSRGPSGPTNIYTQAGTNTINVGSLEPATGGIVDGIQGALTVYGNGTDILNVDDTGSAGGKAGYLTNSTLTGLGMIPAGITYSGLATLNIFLGGGNDTFNILTTFVNTTTNLNDGTGNDTVNVQITSGLTNIRPRGARYDQCRHFRARQAGLPITQGAVTVYVTEATE